MDHEVDWSKTRDGGVNCSVYLFGVVQICVEHKHFIALRMHPREPAEESTSFRRERRVFTLRGPLTRRRKRSASDQNQPRIKIFKGPFRQSHAHVAQSTRD